MASKRKAHRVMKLRDRQMQSLSQRQDRPITLPKLKCLEDEPNENQGPTEPEFT